MHAHAGQAPGAVGTRHGGPSLDQRQHPCGGRPTSTGHRGAHTHTLTFTGHFRGPGTLLSLQDGRDLCPPGDKAVTLQRCPRAPALHTTWEEDREGTYGHRSPARPAMVHDPGRHVRGAWLQTHLSEHLPRSPQPQGDARSERLPSPRPRPAFTPRHPSPATPPSAPCPEPKSSTFSQAASSTQRRSDLTQGRRHWP